LDSLSDLCSSSSAISVRFRTELRSRVPQWKKEARGWTQEVFAQRLGMSRLWVVQLEQDPMVQSISRPKGANYASPGQRPGLESEKQNRALKGRSYLCHNPSSAPTSTWCLAQRTANRSSSTVRTKARDRICIRLSFALGSPLQGFNRFVAGYPPRALPWAIVVRAFGASIPRPNGARQGSLCFTTGYKLWSLQLL
jgi:hypothetical protein